MAKKASHRHAINLDKITKLFLFQPVLRRLVYLGIKEMSKIANDVIIVTSR
jgi:hypothetical protein